MPMYDLQCSSCEHEFEAFASMDDRDNVPCPKCGSRTSQVFKGSRGVDFRPKTYKYLFPEVFEATGKKQFRRELDKYDLAET